MSEASLRVGDAIRSIASLLYWPPMPVKPSSTRVFRFEEQRGAAGKDAGVWSKMGREVIRNCGLGIPGEEFAAALEPRFPG